MLSARGRRAASARARGAAPGANDASPRQREARRGDPADGWSPRPPRRRGAAGRPDGRARAAPPARPSRPRSSGSRPALSRVLGLVREMVAVVLLRRRRADQRVHRRVPDPEPGARARRRRGALLRVRPGLQRPAREGRAPARLARRLEPLLADAARADRADGALHPRRAVGDRPLRQPGQRPRRSRSGSRASSSRSSRCSASPGSSSGSSTATTTSPCRRSRRCSGTSRSSSGS